MSSAHTDCRVPDPTDANADGNFGNHRAGYGSDRLQRAEAWARKGYTLAAGEGLVLVQEIDRLREELAQQSITLSAEHQRAERILAALREPLGTEVEAAAWEAYRSGAWPMGSAIRAAVAAAEQEVGA